MGEAFSSTRADEVPLAWASDVLLAVATDRDGRITWATNRLVERSGRELVGARLTELAAAAQHEPLDRFLRDAGPEWTSAQFGLFPDARGIPSDYQLWTRQDAHGSTVLVEPVFDDVVSLNASLLTLHQELVAERRELVTLREREHDALVALQQAHDARWREALLDRVPVGFAFLDRDLRFLKVNGILADINGVAVADHLGKTIAEVVPGVAEPAIAAFRRVLATGEPIVDLEVAGETAAAPGVERSWHETVYRVDDEQGQPLGVGVLVVETTEQVRLARERALAEARTALLNRTAAALSSAITVREVAEAAVAAVIEGLGAHAGVLHVLAEDGNLLERVYRGPGTADGGELERFELRDELPAAVALRTREAVFLGSPDATAREYPSVAGVHAQLGDQAWALLPLVGSGPLGVLTIRFGESREFAADERELALGLAAQCAPVLERALLFERQRYVAETLQRSILPSALPAIPMLQLSASYRPGAAGLEVGGDWYDAFALPAGRVALVIGDVVGKGVIASATMARLRHTIRAFGLEGESPGALLERVDRSSEDGVTADFATAIYSVFDPATRTVEYARAGHLPPLVRRANGVVETLEQGLSAPLGLGTTERSAATTRLGEGDVFFLYTDGLVERRGSMIDSGIEALAAVLASTDAADLDALVATAVAQAGETTKPDDIAILAARVTAG